MRLDRILKLINTIGLLVFAHTVSAQGYFSWNHNLGEFAPYDNVKTLLMENDTGYFISHSNCISDGEFVDCSVLGKIDAEGGF